MVWAEGRVYEGEWVKNRFSGQGTLTEPDGSSYHGEFKFGHKHGEGVATLSNGEQLKGFWRWGKEDGEMTVVKTEGIRRGIWQKGKFMTWLSDSTDD
jgi:hypothetical protein